jgi:hypothetical protein
MGSVNITLANGQLGGTLQTSDGIAGLMMTGVTEPGYVVGTPILLTNATDADAAGISNVHNRFARRQIKEYYDQAGPGAQLYVMLVAPTMTVADMADNSNADGVRKLLGFAGGKIRIVGLLSDDEAIEDAGTPTVVSNGLNAQVYVAATKMAVTAAAYFERHKPFRAIIGGSSCSAEAAELADMTMGTSNNRTAILVGDTQVSRAACVGLVLGIAAALPVQRKISRVRSGALTNVEAYVGDQQVGALGDDMAVIAQKGFMTFTTYANTSGYYMAGDPMCAATTDDYCMLARGRVVDKAHILAYTTFVQVVDDEVPVNTDGTLDAGFCKWLSQQITNLVNNTMTANREISSIRCYIDPNQNILSTNRLQVVLSIIPVGYATDIRIELGFSNPANEI